MQFTGVGDRVQELAACNRVMAHSTPPHSSTSASGVSGSGGGGSGGDKIGRFELLRWMNEYLQTDYVQITELGDGVAYVQLFDSILCTAAPPPPPPLLAAVSKKNKGCLVMYCRPACKIELMMSIPWVQILLRW